MLLIIQEMVQKKYGINMNNTAKGFSSSGVPSSPMAKAFITNIKGLLQPGYIQGVDIDWEYPGRLPIESICKDKSGVSKACKVNEPTQIGPCDASSNKGCSAFAYEQRFICPSGGVATCINTPGTPLYCDGKASYRLPTSKGGVKASPELLHPFIYLMKGIKKSILSVDSKSELSIAIAGAPNGLSWYINTLSTLIGGARHFDNKDTIDFASIMAYDYNGFWGGGQTSGFLANFTNMTTLDRCQKPGTSKNCQTEDCVNAYKVGLCKSGCPASAPICGSWGGDYKCYAKQTDTTFTSCLPKGTPQCPPSATKWNGCPENVKFQFTKSSGNNYYNPSKAKNCPFILYNGLADDVRDNNSDMIKSFTSNWFDDNNTIKQSEIGSHTAAITLSIKTMLRVLTDVYQIDSKKLVIGLPYYGRSFQTGDDPDNLVTPLTSSFSKGSLGLYQPYQYGTTYSYSDIYQTYYKAGNKKDVYTIMLDKGGGSKPEYTEDIVYAKGRAMLSHVTSDMTEEMISYNSEESN